MTKGVSNYNSKLYSIRTYTSTYNFPFHTYYSITWCLCLLYVIQDNLIHVIQLLLLRSKAASLIVLARSEAPCSLHGKSYCALFKKPTLPGQIFLPGSLWSTTTINTGGVGGEGSPTCKAGSFFLIPLAHTPPVFMVVLHHIEGPGKDICPGSVSQSKTFSQNVWHFQLVPTRGRRTPGHSKLTSNYPLYSAKQHGI